MRRITINALVDIGCLITFIPSLISGLVLYLVLPEGGGRGSGWATYLSIPRNQWVTMHNYTEPVFRRPAHPPPAPALEIFPERHLDSCRKGKGRDRRVNFFLIYSGSLPLKSDPNTHFLHRTIVRKGKFC